MFWKKKNKPEKKFNVPEEARQAYRVVPDPENPILLNLEGISLEVVEISSGGLAFRNKGFQEGSSYKVDFILPTGF